MRPSLYSTALCAVLTLGAVGCAKIEARDLIREGNQLYKDGKFTDAIEKYDSAEQLEPDGVTLFYNRACAAESHVFRIHDAERAQERKEFADMALRDFATYYDRLVEKTDDDDEQHQKHRLALLEADQRCDDLLTHWQEKHRDNPSEEQLYMTVARQYEKCDQPDKSDEWYVKRTKDFPDSVGAWHTLAVRRFEPLFPEDPEISQVNDSLDPNQRLEVADEVIRLLDKATELDSRFRDAYVWRSMAYSQKNLARMQVEDPQLPEEKIENIRAREDTMMAWRQQKAICDLEKREECKDPPEAGCCPPPPLTPQEEATDAELKKEIEAELKAQDDAAAASTNKKNKRKRRRRK